MNCMCMILHVDSALRGRSLSEQRLAIEIDREIDVATIWRAEDAL